MVSYSFDFCIDRSPTAAILVFVSAKAILNKNTNRYILYYTPSSKLVYARRDLFFKTVIILTGEV